MSFCYTFFFLGIVRKSRDRRGSRKTMPQLFWPYWNKGKWGWWCNGTMCRVSLSSLSIFPCIMKLLYFNVLALHQSVNFYLVNEHLLLLVVLTLTFSISINIRETNWLSQRGQKLITWFPNDLLTRLRFFFILTLSFKISAKTYWSSFSLTFILIFLSLSKIELDMHFEIRRLD